MANHVRRAFRDGLADRWSAAVALVLLLLVGAGLAWRGERGLPFPFSGSLVAWAVAASLVPAIHLRFRTRFPLPPAHRGAGSKEERRKGFHLVMGLVLAGYLFLGGWALRLITWGWGLVPCACVETRSNLAAVGATAAGAGQVFSLWVLVGVMLLMLPLELARLARPEGPYVLQRFTELRLRERERRLFGHHLYILIGTVAALLWLAGDPASWGHVVPLVLATVAVTVFADAASAVAGIRWGRTKLPHNPGKSYVGSLAGLVVAFAVAVPFVGLLGATMGALAFLAVDLVAPKPIPVSDNLLNPTLLAGLYSLAAGHLAPMGPWPAWFGL